MKSNAKEFELTSYDDIFKDDAARQEDKLERIQIVPAEKVHPYARQPYSINRPTADLARLMESIDEMGISEPLIVRPMGEDEYEIISGHRRDYCAKELGISERPVIIRDLTDDEADILVADYNITREDLLPSEKAKAYKLKLDAMTRQGRRTDLTSNQIGEMYAGKTSVSVLADQVDENATNIQRYIRLNKLQPELLDYVDSGKLKLVAGADYISALSEKEQKMLVELIDRDEIFPSLDQAKQMKLNSGNGLLTEKIMNEIMKEEKPFEFKVVLNNTKLKDLRPSGYTPKQMEDLILKLLKEWKEKNINRGMER